MPPLRAGSCSSRTMASQYRLQTSMPCSNLYDPNVRLFGVAHTNTRVDGQSRDYFRTSADEKSEYAIHTEKAGGINRGWVAMQGESLDPEGTIVSTVSVLRPLAYQIILLFFGYLSSAFNIFFIGRAGPVSTSYKSWPLMASTRSDTPPAPLLSTSLLR